MHARRQRLALAPVLLALLAGCTRDDPRPGQPSDSADEIGMEQARSDVRQAIVDTLSALPEAYVARFANGDYAACEDEGRAFQYVANGRFDHRTQPYSTPADVSALRDLLVGQRWQPREEAEPSSRLSFAADRGRLSINVAFFADHPYVLVRVLGPCLAATPDERERYAMAEVEPIELPGAAGTSEGQP